MLFGSEVLGGDVYRVRGKTFAAGRKHGRGVIDQLLLLVIDDDPNFNKLFKKFCANERVVAVETIDEGIASAADLLPAYVFLDVRFDCPWRTGIDVIGDVLAVAPRTRVVVMSSTANDYDRRRAMAAGAFAYCQKTDLLKSTDAVSALRSVPAVNRRALRSLSLIHI